MQAYSVNIDFDNLTAVVNDITLTLSDKDTQTMTLSQLRQALIERYKKTLRNKMLPPEFAHERRTHITVLVISKNRLHVVYGTMLTIIEKLQDLCENNGWLWGNLYTKDCTHRFEFHKNRFDEQQWRRCYYTFCLKAAIADSL